MATFVMTNREPRVGGAFALGFKGPCDNVFGDTAERAVDINMNASNSNSTYRGSTFQPSALRGMAIIKV